MSAHSDGPGQGSEFRVRLPLSTDQTPIGARRTAGGFARLNLGGKIVLVVDDNEDAAASLGALLEIAGATVHTAHDGEEAIALAMQVEPEIVLLDIGLPRINGYDVARKIRESSWGRRALLVALTGWGQEDDRKLSGAAGFNHHLVKPVSPESLVIVLSDLSSVTA